MKRPEFCAICIGLVLDRRTMRKAVGKDEWLCRECSDHDRWFHGLSPEEQRAELGSESENVD